MGRTTCVACNKKCKGQAIKLSDAKFIHPKCFTCKECKETLPTDAFFVHDGTRYCLQDYQRLFGTKCQSCDEYIEGEIVTVLDKPFHRKCIFCAKCRRNIDAGDKVTIASGEFCCQACISSAENERTKKDLSKPSEDSITKREEKMSVEKERLTSPDSGFEADMRDGEDDAVLLSPNLLSPTSDASGYKPDVSAAFDSSGAEKTGESSLNAANNVSFDNSNFGTELKSPHDVPNGQLDFGKFYTASFLDKDTGFKRGPSINPQEKSQHHFHRPGDFSYRNVRSDINIKPRKAGMMNTLGGRNQTSSFHRTGDPPYKPIKSQEPIQLAKIPDAQRFNCDHKAPIERDDFIAPPEAAAICPELLRDVRFRRKSEENGDSVDADDNKENEAASDPKIEREISELSKISSSGAAQMILEELKKRRSAEPRELDPRSSSRTPSAAIEPLKKTRYDSPMFASPSRDLLRLRFWQFDNPDDCKYRRCFTPSVPRPGYGLRSQTLDHRSGVMSAMSFRDDTFDRGPGHNSSLGIRSATLGPRNGYTSDTGDGYDPSNFIHRRPEKAVVNSELINGPMSDTEDYDSTTGLKVTRSLLQRLNILVDGRLTPSSRSLRRNVPAIFADHEGAKIFSYESLRLDNQDRPPGIDNSNLEQYLADDEFEKLFRMPRAEFLSLAEWKRNDLKQRVALFESTSEKPFALNTSLEKPPTPITA